MFEKIEIEDCVILQRHLGRGINNLPTLVYPRLSGRMLFKVS